jgi:N-acetylglucosamine-6-phosphate deacetylase
VALDVTDGAVRNSDGALAGSALTLSAAIANAVELGIDPVEALRAVTSAPAALIGRDDVGVLRPGSRADVAVLDDDLVLRTTYLGGVPVA